MEQAEALEIMLDGNSAMLAGSGGCLSRGTIVQTPCGPVNIEDLGVGDEVYTFDGKHIGINKINFKGSCRSIPKPMIEFKYNEETIRTTYDHPFYDGEKYYPLYQLIWGGLEAGERIQLKLLCEQYGQTFNFEEERGKTHRDNETWERPGRAFAHSNEWQDDKSASSGSANLDRQPEKITYSKSHKQQTVGQSSRESRMVYSSTQYKTRLRSRKYKAGTRKGCRGVEKIPSRGCFGYSKVVGHEYRWSRSKRYVDSSRIVASVAGDVPTHPASHTKTYATTHGKLWAGKVCEAEEYYYIGVENVHTYFIGNSWLPTHNSGKSHTLRQFIERNRLLGRKTAVTATTGLAASHLNGQTLHSWARVGLGKELPDDWQFTISKKKRKEFQTTATLVIDEVSMMPDFVFDMLDTVLRWARNDDRPFGGIQLILCGDFYQLPPVEGKFITNSKVWNELNIRSCYLTKVYRQKDDRLRDLLAGVRGGKLFKRHIAYVQSRMVKPDRQVLRLYSLNRKVDSENAHQLRKLKGDSIFYMMTEKGDINIINGLKGSIQSPELLELKVGAPVIATKNNSEGLYHNGSLGKVVSLEGGLPVVDFHGVEVIVSPDTWEVSNEGVTLGSVTQIPLRLAYAITVHKSQGMTLDAAEIDLAEAFVPGQGYVALSRVVSLDGLYIKGANKMAFQMSDEARMIDKVLQKSSKEKTPPRMTGREE